MKTDLFQPCAHCSVSIFAGILSAALSQHHHPRFDDGIPSHTLALFIVMHPKAHLTSHFRMSGSMWVITPSWLSGFWRSFLCTSSVYSCHLFLISCASVRSLPFPSYTEPIFAWNVPLVSLMFLKTFLFFPILLFSCISLHWSLRKALLSLVAYWVHACFVSFMVLNGMAL